MSSDVPITVDFRHEDVARDWTDSAISVRPWRVEFFDAFVEEIGKSGFASVSRVLELGSGPGFLAERLLTAHAAISYVAVDFSAAMHSLAKKRLSDSCAQAKFIERNLRDADWSQGLGDFDFAVTHQAVHELRHKRYAPILHGQVRVLLKPGGTFLVCDHFYGEGGMSNDQLYMSVEEQRQALLDAGFTRVEQVLLSV